MEEGEGLSKKQLAQETTIKKLRAAAKEAAEKYGSLQAELASQNGRLRNAIASAAASDKAKQVTFPTARMILPRMMALSDGQCGACTLLAR